MSLLDDLTALGIKIPTNLDLDAWAARLGDKPFTNTAALVAASSLLFYATERDHNPKVNDIFDAMVYCSTCLSVGYGDIFAKTPVGKLLGTALMTLGPALSGAALDGKPASLPDPTQAEILTTLKKILEKLDPTTPENQ
jgi:hypothetical protein